MARQLPGRILWVPLWALTTVVVAVVVRQISENHVNTLVWCILFEFVEGVDEPA